MLDSLRLAEIRNRLDLSQEAMARVLGVSFASINRWENRHSAPSGTVLEVYRALDVALRAGRTRPDILGDDPLEPGRQLHRIFALAYGEKNGVHD